MKKFFSQCCLFLWMAVALASSGYAASAANAHDIYGKPYHFLLHSKKWIIINYWAAWCGFCIREIPELNKLAKAVETLPAVFFAVNYDDASDQDQQAFARSHQINYVLLHNNPFENLISRSQIATLPATFLISPEGQVQEIDGELNADDVLGRIH